MQLLAKFEKILYMGFRATLNFRKFKVALNPMYRIFNFRYADFNTDSADACILVMACVGVCRLRVRVQLKTLSSLLKVIPLLCIAHPYCA